MIKQVMLNIAVAFITPVTKVCETKNYRMVLVLVVMRIYHVRFYIS